MQAKWLLSWIWWPLVFGVAMLCTAYGFGINQPLLYFNLIYFSLIAVLLILEMWFPHEQEWEKSDGQTWVNIAHTLSSKATVQGLLLFGGIIGLTELITPIAGTPRGIWPRDWPMAVQVCMAVVSAEFMLYWAHRLAHEHDVLWRLHAIHHSVTKLWVVNTGRFHVLDSVLKISGSIALLIILGVPMEVIQWLMAITAYIGVLTHCNVEMRCGWLSYIFNTPEVHRWHHSKVLREGNSNYGENVVIWDLIFGTYFKPKDRRPPAKIGITDVMPARFVDQLLYPFRRAYYRKRAAEKTLKTYP